jgi:hypothetical protein
MTIRTLMSIVRARSAVIARWTGDTAPRIVAATKSTAAASGRPAAPAANPAPIARAQAITRRDRRVTSAPYAAGCSCSSHMRMPVWPTASTIASVVSLAASYFTWSR